MTETPRQDVLARVSAVAVLRRSLSLWMLNLPSLLVMAMLIFSPVIVKVALLVPEAAAEDPAEDPATAVEQTAVNEPAAPGSTEDSRPPAPAADPPEGDLGAALTSLLFLVLPAVYLGCVTHGLRVGAGQRLRLSECLGIAGRSLLGAVSVGMAVGMVLAAASILVLTLLEANPIVGLVVFLILLRMLVTWCLAVPAAAAEQLGIVGSLRRSIQLTSGLRWKILGLSVASGCLSLVLYRGLHFLAVPADLEVWAELGLTLVTQTLLAVFLAVLYFETTGEAARFPAQAAE